MRVHAKDDLILHWEGSLITIRKDQAFDSGDSIVKDHPDAFYSDQELVPSRRRVERATAAPGEVRDL